MAARIYRPAKAATQSGMARTKQWLLVFEQDRPREIEPLMGWTASGDTRQQLRLWFDTARRRLPMPSAGHPLSGRGAARIEAPDDVLFRQLQVQPRRRLDPLTVAAGAASATAP